MADDLKRNIADRVGAAIEAAFADRDNVEVARTSMLVTSVRWTPKSGRGGPRYFVVSLKESI